MGFGENLNPIFEVWSHITANHGGFKTLFPSQLRIKDTRQFKAGDISNVRKNLMINMLSMKI